MTQWAHNIVGFGSCKPGQMTALANALRSKGRVFDFSRIIKMPIEVAADEDLACNMDWGSELSERYGTPNFFEWKYLNWGCTSNALSPAVVHTESKIIGGKRYRRRVYDFETANGCPQEVYLALLEKFPGLSIISQSWEQHSQKEYLCPFFSLTEFDYLLDEPEELEKVRLAHSWFNSHLRYPRLVLMDWVAFCGLSYFEINGSAEIVWDNVDSLPESESRLLTLLAQRQRLVQALNDPDLAEMPEPLISMGKELLGLYEQVLN